MEPEYAVGDILITREKDPSTIKVGDNIVYLGNTGDYNGKIITHNVIKIEQNEQGEYLFHTKGIANTIEDPLDTVTKNEYYKKIEKTIDESLSDFEKKVLSKFIDGQSYIQIAQSLNSPVKSIDNAIQRIRKKAIKSLDGE